MEKRTYIYALGLLFFCIMPIKVLGQNSWVEIHNWVVADTQVPDKEEVLMLIQCHYKDSLKLDKLLRYLNGGKAYTYLSKQVFSRIDRREKKIDKLSIAMLELPTATSLVKESISEQRLIAVSDKMGKKEGEKRLPLGRTVLAIKNNLLYDLALAPNLEIELPMGQRWSLNVEYKCPWWVNNRHNFCYQLLSGGIEARYWLGNRQTRNRLTGHFFGVYAEGGKYDFQFGKEDGCQGKYYGAVGLTYGYSYQLARQFAIEFSLGIGYLTTEYRKYTSYEGDLVWKSGNQYNFIGPTKAKISLVWLIARRR